MKIEEVEEEHENKDKEVESAMKLLKSYVKARDEGIASRNPELEALMDAMKQQQESFSEDVVLPKDGTQRAKSETIIPKPIFVIKTATSKGKKIFINMCSSPKIPAPAEWEGGIPADVEEALKGNTDSESLLDIPNVRFPVSCSDPKSSTDHGGQPCQVFDMVYNSSIVEFMMSNKKMKLFLIEMAMSWISQKYSLELNSDFKLPNMKYKGNDVTSQHIRATPVGPLVSEIPCNSDLDPSFPLLVKPQAFRPQVSTTNGSSQSVLCQGSATQTGLEKPSKFSSNQPTSRAGSTILNSNLSSCNVSTAEMFRSGNECLPFTSPRKSSSPSNTSSMDGPGFTSETKLEDKQQVLGVRIGQPLIELAYNLRPVDAVFVMISLPQVKHGDLEIFVTYTQLLIKTKSYEPLEVLLPFCPELSAVDASYDVSKELLTLKLPILPYVQALDDSHGQQPQASVT